LPRGSAGLKAIHFGRSVRIKPEALEAYINSIPAKEPKVRQLRAVR